MYGDLETYEECWFAIVPHYEPWWDEGEYEYEESQRNARTVLPSIRVRKSQ